MAYIVCSVWVVLEYETNLKSILNQTPALFYLKTHIGF